MESTSDPIPIEVLGLSKRPYNSLKRAGINSIEELLRMPDSDISALFGMGVKAHEELITKLNQFVEFHSHEKTESEQVGGFPDYLKYQIINFLHLINLGDLGIDKDLLLRLQSYGMYSLFDVYERQNNQLFTQRFINILNELSENLKLVVSDYPINRISPADRMIVNTVLSKLLAEFNLIEPILLEKAIGKSLSDFRLNSEVVDDSSYLSSSQFRKLLCSNLVVSSANLKILNLIENAKNGIGDGELMDGIPTWMPVDILRGALIRAAKDNRIEKNVFNRWVICKRPLLEFIQSLSNERDTKILLGRLQGNTLESISVKLGISRERVRQIASRILKNKPPIAEDDYIPIYQEYSFTKENFCELLDVSTEVFGYVALISDRKGTKPLEEMLNDPSIPDLMIKRLIEILNRGSIPVEKSRIPKKDRSIIDYLVRQNVNKNFSVDDFFQIYFDFLNEHDIDNAEFNIDVRYFKGILYRNKNVLTTIGHNFEIVDYEGIDTDELIELLELRRLKDVEFSTLKLFQQFPKVLDRYGICDHYALHSLLKKIHINTPINKDMFFLRTPIIKVGKGNRNKQVLELLRQNSPISQDKLADIYYEKYGVEQRTFKANFLKDFQKYYKNSYYDIALKTS